MEKIPVCSWKTSLGELSIINVENTLKLQLEDKNKEEVVFISENNIFIEDKRMHFNSNVEKIQQFASSYFPLVQKKKESVHVTFYEIVSPGTVVKEEGFSVNKCMEGFSGNRLEEIRYLDFSHIAPIYRRVIRGLNLEGTCVHDNCEAFNKKVMIPIGIGDKNIGEMISESPCPSCGNILKDEKVTNLGFWDCSYTIKGKRVNEENIFSKEGIAPKDRYQTYNPNDNCKWKWLQIKTEKIAIEESSSICYIL